MNTSNSDYYVYTLFLVMGILLGSILGNNVGYKVRTYHNALNFVANREISFDDAEVLSKAWKSEQTLVEHNDSVQAGNALIKK